MSTHATTHATTHRTTRGTVATTRQPKQVNTATVLRRLALGACATIALTAIAAAPAPAINQDHHGGTGVTVPVQSPSPLNCHNYPKDECEVPSSGAAVGPGDGRQGTSVALGALGGIALAGAGLGITLGVQRRRQHATPQMV
jgi:hypothetical protein